MIQPNELIIIGGGASLKKGISMGLWDNLSNKFVISCNYTYNDFPTATLSTFVDQDYYKAESKKTLFQNLPLITGKIHPMKPLPNTIMLNTGAKYNRNLKNGVFKSSLCGLFSLSLGIYLLNIGTIYLLGFDYGNIKNEKDSDNKFKTHYYQEDKTRKHRGIGRVNYYCTKNRADKDFGNYVNETKVKIYNVSLNSNINVLSKLSYEQFFQLLSNKTYNQKELRNSIKHKLEVLR